MSELEILGLANETIKKVKAIYGSRVLNNEINKKAQNFSHSIRIAGNIFLTKLSNLINDPILRNKIANNARSKVLKKYTYHNLIHSTEKLY